MPDPAAPMSRFDAWSQALLDATGGRTITPRNVFSIGSTGFYNAIAQFYRYTGGRHPGVDAAKLERVRGIVPKSLAFVRTAFDNPTLDLNGRMGSVGGLSNSPLIVAKSLGVDPRTPWEATFVLLYRLRTIAEFRLRQLESVWGELWGGDLSNGTEDFLKETMSHFTPWYGRLTGSVDEEEVERAAQRITEQWQTSPYELVATSSPGALINTPLFAFRANKPPFWPWALARMAGFWKMVLLEERCGGNERVEKLWNYIAGRGFVKYFVASSQEESMAAIAALPYLGWIFAPDPFVKAVQILGSSASDVTRQRQIGLSQEDVAILSREVSNVNSMFGIGINFIEDVRNATLGVDPRSELSNLFQWNNDTDIWAGQVHGVPALPIVPPNVPHDLPSTTRPERKGVSLLFPLLVTAGAIGFIWFAFGRRD